MTKVKGFALTGAEVSEMKDTLFTIATEPKYVDMEYNGKTEEKMLMTIKIDGHLYEYIPNRTSVKVIMAQKGRELADWVGWTGKFVTKDQVVAGKDKKVIYIEAVE